MYDRCQNTNKWSDVEKGTLTFFVCDQTFVRIC